MIAFILVAEVILLALLLAGLAIMSAADAAVPHISRGRSRRLVDSERRGAHALDTLLEHPGRLVAAAAVTRAVVYSVSSASLGWVLLNLTEVPQAWLTLLGGATLGLLLVFTIAEALPRTLAVHNPERVALAAAPLANVLLSLLYPVARLLGSGWTSIVNLISEERISDAWVTPDELRSSSNGDDEETSRDEAEDAIIDAVADFTSKIVREVMVPRTDMVCLEDTATVGDALDLIEESGVSRLPVYHDTVDDILGVLYAKDLLIFLGRGSYDLQLAKIAREPLAETAAQQIGANALLTRVGAYYHDVGKILRPGFFVENQAGMANPHDNTSPSLSALIITAHVREGVELAEEYRLPQEVVEIVRQHHGTSMVMYFYNKAAAAGGPVFEADFRYSGERPRSREAALVMLADSCEAAVRATSKPTPPRIEEVVRKVVAQKLADHQLDLSNLTLAEIEAVTVVYTRLLASVYHPRVEYPEVISGRDKNAGQRNEPSRS